MVAVTVTGLALETLTDVTDAVFLAKGIAAGLTTAQVLAREPRSVDFVGIDPTGATSSHAGFLLMAAACNLGGYTGRVMPGNYVLDGATSITLRNGGGLSGVPMGQSTNGYDDGRRNVVFKVPYSGNRMVPVFAMQRGSLLENVQFHYPDVVSRLTAGTYTIDATSYPTITGAPEAYAPAIVTQHKYNDDGSASATGENVGGVVLRNIGMFGAYDGIFCGDADTALETWATAYSSGKGKGIPGIVIDGFYGYVLRRNLVLQRANNGVFCRKFHFTPGMWTEAGQSTDVHAISGNDQPLIKWAQQNNIVVTCNRKVLASWDGLYARCGRKVFHFEALTVAPHTTITGATRGATTAFDVPTGHGLTASDYAWIGNVVGLDSLFVTPAAYLLASVTATTITVSVNTSAATAYSSGGTVGGPSGPLGQDSGKFRPVATDLRIERYPTLARWEENAYSHRPIFSGQGHHEDYDDTTCVLPVFDAQIDSVKAGSIDKSSGAWKPTGNYVGWRIYIRNYQCVECAGPFFQNTAEDPTNYWIFEDCHISRWAQGSKLTLSAFENNSTVAEIHHTGGTMTAADNAGKRVYDVADVTAGAGQKLHPVGVKYRGCNTLVLLNGVAETNWPGFVGCSDEATLNTADEADDDESGNPGDVDTPTP